MADVANMHRDYIVYVTRHSPLSLVQQVDHRKLRPRLCRLTRNANRTATGRARSGSSPTSASSASTRRPASSSSPRLMPGVTRDRDPRSHRLPRPLRRRLRGDAAARPRKCCRILREEVDPLGLRRLEFVGVARSRRPPRRDHRRRSRHRPRDRSERQTRQRGRPHETAARHERRPRLLRRHLHQPARRPPRRCRRPPDGSIWCGNEIGELLRIDDDGRTVERLGSTDGFLLGLAFDRAGNCFACDLKHSAIFRYDAATRRFERFASSGIRVPNYPVVDEERGFLYVSDSAGDPGPGIFRYRPGDRRRRPLVCRPDPLRQRHGHGA